MSYWYKFDYYSTSLGDSIYSAQFTDNDFIGFKKPLNGVLYGTKKYPLWSMQIGRPYNEAFKNGVSYLYGYTDVNRGTGVGSFLRLWGSGSVHRRGYTTIFYSSTPYTKFAAIQGAITELPHTTISGKYRLKPVLSTFNAACWGAIPVNFSLKGATYNNIGFSAAKIDWWSTYDTGGSKSTAPVWSTLFNISHSGQYVSTTRNAPVVSVYRDDTITDTSADLVYISDNYTDIYAGEIIDFGSSPQEVPQIFVDWLLNSADPIYPYTFTVKSQNGVNALASLEEAPAMIDATPSAVGNVKTLTMTGVNGKKYTMTWESETPAGKQFLGLAYGANETRASIPTGRTTPVTWDGSLTIYEAYGTYRPPVTTFDINLYQSSAEVNRVDKTDYLTGVGTLSGVLREECSIIAPSITFKQTTVPTFNYVYIAAFGRYYYVTGITSVSKDIWRMSLSCDVLMTWKDDIRALTAIIARQENIFNPLLLDSELPAQANQNITVTEFPAGGFSTDSEIAYPFILTVVGA